MSFNNIANQIILQIQDHIEELDVDCLLDLEYEEGVLTINSSQGTFILNKHAASQEVWLSSPTSGAHHFKYISGKWLDNEQREMQVLLYDEIKRLISES